MWNKQIIEIRFIWSLKNCNWLTQNWKIWIIEWNKKNCNTVVSIVSSKLVRFNGLLFLLPILFEINDGINENCSERQTVDKKTTIPIINVIFFSYFAYNSINKTERTIQCKQCIYRWFTVCYHFSRPDN